ncbi:MAG: NAD(P)-dependent oxidoreductase [Porticoccaceae bacterium]
MTVTNVTGYGTASVVQHCFALILSLATRLPDYNCAALNGQWSKSPFFCLLDYPIQQLSGATMGIVGYGKLGRSMAKIASAFGMHVKIAGLPGRHPGSASRVPLEELLSQGGRAFTTLPANTKHHKPDWRQRTGNDEANSIID